VPSTVIGLNDATTANCPSRNPPEAVIGRLCVHVNGVSNAEASTVSVQYSGPYGFGIEVDATTGNVDYPAAGVWAVTGPQPGATP
jgi:hypothetical protein